MSRSVLSRGPWVPAAGRAVLVGAVATGVILGAASLDAVPPATSPGESASVPATLTTAYCPGDPFAGGGKDAPRVDPEGSVEAHAARAKVLDGLVSPSDEPGELSVRALTEAEPTATPGGDRSSDPASAATTDLGERAVRVRGTEDRAPGLVATQSLSASGESVRGLAAAPCTAPTADAWLVAGGGDKGRQERLVLTNPGANAVTVRIDVVGTDREGADRSVVVPARGREVVLLDAVAGTSAPQAVHVTSTGGLVVPAIVDTHLDGLTPAGVDLVGPTAAPAKRLVLPGTANGAERGIVLAAPGEREAVVQISRIGEGPQRSAEVVTVPAGEVVDVALPRADGVHSWLVESDEDVVAAAHVSTEDASGVRDMAWSVATPTTGDLGGAALPTAPSQDVRRFVEVTAADGPASAEVLVLRDDEVTSTRIELEDGRSKAVSVGAASAVWVRPSSGRVHSAVLLITREGGPDARAASLPVLPARVAVRDVSVERVR